MAGSVTQTVKAWGSMKLVKFACTSDASTGAADATTTESFDGAILLVCTDPGATAPDDNWDLVLQDDNSVDLLAGQGANRDTANTEYINSGMGGLAQSTLTLGVTNAGNSKTLTVYVYIR
jgi:hypothetical protein